MRNDESILRPQADSRGSGDERKSPVDLQQVLIFVAELHRRMIWARRIDASISK